MLKNVEHRFLGEAFIAKGYIYFAWSKEYPKGYLDYITESPTPNPTMGGEVVGIFTRGGGQKQVSGYLIISDSPNIHGMSIAGGWIVEAADFLDHQHSGNIYIVKDHFEEDEDSSVEHLFTIAGVYRDNLKRINGVK